MSKRTIIRQACAAVTLIMLSACGSSEEVNPPTPDTAIIFTQAAQTVAAQFTQTSAAQTAFAPTATNPPAPTLPVNTFTPIATLSIVTFPPGGANLTPILQTPAFPTLPGQTTPAGPLCDNSAFVRDIGTLDGTVLKPGQAFSKGWLIQNTGTCNWVVGYHLVRVGGNTDFGGDLFVIRSSSQIVLAGQIAEISLNLIAPKTPGSYEARYQMYNDRDVPFGTGMTVAVEVRK